jgi:hypothetical protein
VKKFLSAFTVKLFALLPIAMMLLPFIYCRKLVKNPVRAFRDEVRMNPLVLAWMA